MADALIGALRARKLSAVRAAVKAKPEAARHPRAILEASRLAFQQALELFHRNGADMNAAWRNYRPLHALMQEEPHAEAGQPAPERLACLDWLLEHGANPEQLGAWPPARAIIIAAFAGQPEYVTRLRKAGAKLDGFAAAALGDRKLVEKALRERPQLARERDHGGLTALQCAAGSRMPGAVSVEIARILIDAGADVSALTKSWAHDIDAAYLAAGNKNQRLFELLLDRGADATEALSHAVWGGHYELAEMALARGADPDRATANGKPLLNDLIRWGQVKPTIWLLARGASPNVPDADGWTSVHQAAARGNARMIKAVLDAGGDPARRDHQGHTPADLDKGKRLVALMS
ncbi:MAG TPA: ankyrin repeat domain-containing protein [Bryobacteraceae bacterium]|nr:ankyrin repeat domain-containing protein [Bryobacteraceae bacterium]